MIYFGALLSMICLLLGSLIIASVKDLLSQDSKVSRSSLKTNSIISFCVFDYVFLLSPLWFQFLMSLIDTDQMIIMQIEGWKGISLPCPNACDRRFILMPMRDMMMMIWIYEAQQLGIMLG